MKPKLRMVLLCWNCLCVGVFCDINPGEIPYIYQLRLQTGLMHMYDVGLSRYKTVELIYLQVMAEDVCLKQS